VTPLAADKFGDYVDTNSTNPAGPVGDHIHSVYLPVFIASCVVFFGVAAAIIYFALRYRRKADDEEPAQVHGNSRLEIVWTAIPAAILISIFTWTTVRMPFINNPPDNVKTLRVCVQGQQFNWSYFYEASCGPGVQSGERISYQPTDKKVVKAGKLYVPIGVPVDLEVVSVDVNHSFYLPGLGGQVNAIPGQHNETWFQVDGDATRVKKSDGMQHYYGACTELCGSNHYTMTIEVIAMPQKDFDAWMAKQQQQQGATAGAGGNGGS